MRRSGTIALFASVSAAVGLFPGVADAVPWPIDNVNQVHRVANTYGQFQDLGGLHMHEGIDIPAAPGTQVKAVKDGLIVNVHLDAGTPYNQYITIEDVDDEHGGWGYVHIAPTAGLANGQSVTAGTVLGTVLAYPGGGFPDHLHFERDADFNGGWPAFGGGIEHLRDNPLSLLNPATDNVGPTTSDSMLFRRAEDEGNDATPKYMTTLSCGYKLIGSRAPNGSGNVDVIADSFDRFGSFADKLGIREIRLDANGRLTVGNDQIPANQTLVDFRTDHFLPNNNNFNDFRSPALTQVIYEHDSVALSKQFGPYYHILTNQSQDDGPIVAGNANYFWDTDGTRGQQWRDNNPADRAPNNAKSAFRDDIYTVFARAFDAASNVGTGVDHVLLDNWLQTVFPDKNVYDLGETVAASHGEQYLPSDSVPLFVLQTLPAVCDPIASGGILASALSNLTNLDGVLPFSDVWSANMQGDFILFADYDHDGIFIPELDAYAPFLVVPEPTALAATALFTFAIRGPMSRRRRGAVVRIATQRRS